MSKKSMIMVLVACCSLVLGIFAGDKIFFDSEGGEASDPKKSEEFIKKMRGDFEEQSFKRKLKEEEEARKMAASESYRWFLFQQYGMEMKKRDAMAFLRSKTCGDGILQYKEAGEQCDDGNLIDGDGCSRYCLPEICGNGIRDLGEQCDDGNLVNGDGCDSSCRIEMDKK